MTQTSLTFDDCVILLSPIFTDKPFKSHLYSCGDLNTMNYVFESLIFNLLVIVYFLISEIASIGCSYLKEIIPLKGNTYKHNFRGPQTEP